MRLFTLEEARALLPELIPLLEELRQAVLRLRAIEAARSAAARGATADGHDLEPPFAVTPADPAEGPIETVRLASRVLQDHGVELKDPAQGLIDFPHLRDGRTVYLCFRLGEPTIQYWHERHTGFAGRQPLEP